MNSKNFSWVGYHRWSNEDGNKQRKIGEMSITNWSFKNRTNSILSFCNNYMHNRLHKQTFVCRRFCFLRDYFFFLS